MSSEAIGGATPTAPVLPKKQDYGQCNNESCNTK